MRENDLAALVLHVRPYQETSGMVQFFTREHGRLVGVKKGMRRGRNPVSIQPFSYGRLSYVGRSNLVTITQYDPEGRYEMHGDHLSAGFYVLELLTRCVTERQSEPGLFKAACDVLAALQSTSPLAPTLRKFEARLLSELGYGIDYLHEAGEGRAILAQERYRWVAGQGFQRIDENAIGSVDDLPGWVLHALSEQDYSRPETLRCAKHLYQKALSPLLGSAPLISREMVRASSTGTLRHV
ncbi:MAG: DNA repair protein RecO [Pseudomonadaceae bacterium]|nr:DNA repair protein RecO [Pseudomonadaceae bacterium]